MNTAEREGRALAARGAAPHHVLPRSQVWGSQLVLSLGEWSNERAGCPVYATGPEQEQQNQFRFCS
jgi:hypothetical protein